jgi:hypothetical protein
VRAKSESPARGLKACHGAGAQPTPRRTCIIGRPHSIYSSVPILKKHPILICFPDPRPARPSCFGHRTFGAFMAASAGTPPIRFGRAVQPAPNGQLPPRNKASGGRGPEPMEEDMRVISQTDLMRLPRTELMVLQQRIAGELACLPTKLRRAARGALQTWRTFAGRWSRPLLV